MNEKIEKKRELLKTASEGHDLVVLCKQCGELELKRRRHRSDALGWQRLHEKEKPSHAVEIVERKAEEKPAKKSKQPAAPKKEKGKSAKAKSAKPKAEAQAA